MNARTQIQSRLLNKALVLQRRQDALRRLAMQLDDTRTAHLRFNLQGALLGLNRPAEALLGRDQSQALGLHLSGDWLKTMRQDGWIEISTRGNAMPLLLVLLAEEDNCVHTALTPQDATCEVVDESLSAFVGVARKTAHDFNNMLSTVTGYAELAVMLSNEPRIKQYLSEIYAGAKRGQALVKEFQLRLMQSDIAQASAPTTPREAIPDNGEHILIVDDDMSIADLLAEILRSAGYRVTTCYRAREALVALQRDPTVSLLLSDQSMPELTGTELAREALRLRPELPFILCTGWGDTITSPVPGDYAVRNLIAKPIEAEALLQLVRNLLPDVVEAQRDEQPDADREAGLSPRAVARDDKPVPHAGG